MSAKLFNEIVLREELRPAIYTSHYGETIRTEVLVHTTRSGNHGGWLLEDEHGGIFEYIESNKTSLKFTDCLHDDYCFIEDGV